MKDMIETVKRVFKRKPKGAIYFRVLLDGPIVGIFETEPQKPWIRVEGMTLADAAQAVPRIDWHTVPMTVRAALELGNKCLTITAKEAKAFLKEQA